METGLQGVGMRKWGGVGGDFFWSHPKEGQGAWGLGISLTLKTSRVEQKRELSASLNKNNLLGQTERSLS